MKKNINRSEFHNAFANMGRMNNFTPQALDALFDYLEEYEAGTGEAIELDVIALCCEYTEFVNIAEFNEQYGKDFTNINQIIDFTSVIPIDGTDRFIIQNY